MTARDIILETAQAYGVNPIHMKQPQSRNPLQRSVVHAKWEAMYRIRKERDLSYPQIARIFNMHHTTVMHGIKKHLEIVGEAA